MSITSAPFRLEPRGVRPLRFAALLGLALAVTLLATLLLLSTFPLLHTAVKQLIGWFPDPDAPKLAGWLTVAFIVLVPTALLAAMWRFRLRSWWWVGGGWLVVAPVLAYLATDDPTLRQPLTVAEIAPAFPGAEKSFAVIMRYGKNQPAARTLVRQMIGIVIERVSTRTIRWVLDNATVSPAARVRLATALTGGGGALGARRLVTVDYLQSTATLLDEPLGDFVNATDRHGSLRLALNLLSPFVYNRRATANLFGDHILELQDLAAHRELTQFARRQDEFLNQDARPRFKNFMGAFVINQTIPAYRKVLETYWKTEDDRLALLALLAKN